MKRLLTTILVLIIIAVAGFLISPKFMAPSMKTTLQNEIDHLNSTPGAVSNISISDYQSGWFSSHATLHATIPISNANISAPITIKQGPAYLGNGSLHFGQGAVLITGNTPLFQGHALITCNWDGKCENSVINIKSAVMKIHPPALNGKDNISTQLTLTNALHTAHLSDTKIKSHLSIQQATISVLNKQGMMVTKITLNNINNDHNFTLYHKLLGVGTGSASIDNIAINTVLGAKLGTINNVTINATTSLSSDQTTYNLGFNYNIESINIMGVTIKPITLSFEVQNLNTSGMLQLIKGLKAALKEEHNDLSQNKPLSKATATVLADGIANIVKSGLTVKLNKIYIGIPKQINFFGKQFSDLGPISANMEFDMAPLNTPKNTPPTADPQTQPATLEQQMTDMLTARLQPLAPQLMEAVMTGGIKAKGQVELPPMIVKALISDQMKKVLDRQAVSGQPVTETPDQLASKVYQKLISMDLLTQTHDGMLKVSAAFNKGKVLVNGQQPPKLSDLVAAFMPTTITIPPHKANTAGAAKH